MFSSHRPASTPPWGYAQISQNGSIALLYILLWTNGYVLLRVTIKPRIHTALFLLLTSLAGASYAQIPQIERDALVALYNSTDGANWTDNTGWLGEAGTECSWFGVRCYADSGKSVSNLFFWQNGLNGTIPSELGNLSNLTNLHLGSNSLTGTIPSELGNLTKLGQILLFSNSLTGGIPSELGNLANLTYLQLSNNSLSGSIPSELGNLTNLISLYLHSNTLSGSIPSELGNLTNLTILYLYSNSLSGSIPSELGNLTNLTALALNVNSLTGSIPSELGNLTNLNNLDLTSNSLSGSIPSELGNLTNLTDLSLGNNTLSGSIPSELGNLTNLTSLSLDSNTLSGSIPTQLGNLTKLTSLDLSENKITGGIPDSLQILKGLTVKISVPSLGTIIPNTNKALPSSYNFQEYVFPEPNDEGVCAGVKNASAVIGEIFSSQTHRLNLTSPLFFTIGYRPALFQVAVTGSGKSPDVKVLGFHGKEAIGTLCLKGPANLSNTVNTSVADFENYFSVTIPKSWIRPDLTLDLYVDDQLRTLSKEELKIGPYTEMNLVMLEMDVLDYNTAPHRTPIISNFLQEVASAFPASVIRYGEFPVRLKFPELIASNGTEKLVRLRSKSDKLSNNITSDGSINSVMKLFLNSLHKSTGDYLSTFYFGNTLNLAPGGWGGGKSLVSFDFDDVFLHELGHAFSLPHWGESAWDIDPTKRQYLYPYSGDAGTSTEAKGGGRGESWNFIQDIYEFINPICQFNARGKAGLETSDAMQRNNYCLEGRSTVQGPWDGFGDFSALAMHRYLVGAAQKNGRVWYKGGARDFQLIEQEGFPVMSLGDGKRTYRRDPIQAADGIPQPYKEERLIGLGEELIESEAYLVYGTTHPTQADANIIYEPIKFTGTIPAIIDPTDTKMIQDLRTDTRYETLFYQPRDITLKMYYEDGSTLHAINSVSSFQRQDNYPADRFHIFRYDLNNFALVVPGDRKLSKVELYHRPFHMQSWAAADPGYIDDKENPITAENFMDEAVLMSSITITGNISPLVTISDSSRTISDIDDVAGESVNFTATATDSDGTIATTQWLVDGVEVGTGLSASFSLPNGPTVVTFQATDDDGESSATTATITVEAPNVSPVVAITGGDRTVADSDKAGGESVTVIATATDSDGTIATTQWLVDGVEVAAGLNATLALSNGSTVVTFKATDNGGASSTTTATITVASPVSYEPTVEWPSPYNGVTPDASYGLEFNNIGVLNSADATIYVCLRIFTDGLPSAVNGVSQFDMGLKVASLSEVTVQITKFREFDAISALNEKGQTPDCSGIFETTTGVYTDIIQTDTSVLETTWNLIDPTNLILKLDSFKELTAN